MALPLRTRAIPQCTACLRSYAWPEGSNSALRQQVRGKAKMAKGDGNVPVRLLKDLVGFGKRGSVIPVPRGEMRNKFFPQRIAEYITQPELRHLRATEVPIQRDYVYGKEEPLQEIAMDGTTFGDVSIPPPPPKKKPEIEKLTPERSLQLLEIFVGPRLDFYRQPIIEEKEEKEEEEKKKKKPESKESPRTASSAAFDLLAARTSKPKTTESTGPLAIYGSVSTHDILVHIRAAIARNDEAAKVLLEEEDIVFLDAELEKEGKVKHVGDFTIEIKVKGCEERLKRTVRVEPQDM